MTIDGSGRSKPDADQALDVDQAQQDGAQESDPTPVGTWDPDADKQDGGAGSEEAGNGGDGAPQG